jgi:hypothetical protein
MNFKTFNKRLCASIDAEAGAMLPFQKKKIDERSLPGGAMEGDDDGGDGGGGGGVGTGQPSLPITPTRASRA